MLQYFVRGDSIVTSTEIISSIIALAVLQAA